MAEVLGADAFATLRPMVDRALAGERLHFESRVHYQAIGPRDVHIDYVPDVEADGHVRGCYALIQDIGERKATEMRLLESEARFRSLADHAPVMVWVTEADGTLQLPFQVVVRVHGSNTDDRTRYRVGCEPFIRKTRRMRNTSSTQRTRGANLIGWNIGCVERTAAMRGRWTRPSLARMKTEGF